MKAGIRKFLRNYWVEMVVIPPFLLWLCYYFYGDAYFSSWQNFFNMTLPWVFTAFLSPIGCHWVRNLALKRFTRLEDWPKRVVFSIIGYLFFTIGLAKATYFGLVYSPIEELVPPTSDAFYGMLIIASMCVLITAILYEGITYFEKWKSALTEAELLEKLTLETQFQSLQSQLNPHFLFNSLNVLSSLITESPRRAEDFVDELSNVYRYLLRSNERELATLGDELKFIRSYFHLLQTRHDTGINLTIEVDEEATALKVPALALQLLVENAVKHNEIDPAKPLHIEIISQQCMPTGSPKLPNPFVSCRIIVKNNLQPKSVRPQSHHVGLDNLRQRYDLLGVGGFEVIKDNRYFTVALPLIAGESGLR